MKFILVGRTGSGKTTFAEKLIKRFRDYTIYEDCHYTHYHPHESRKLIEYNNNTHKITNEFIQRLHTTDNWIICIHHIVQLPQYIRDKSLIVEMGDNYVPKIKI